MLNHALKHKINCFILPSYMSWERRVVVRQTIGNVVSSCYTIVPLQNTDSLDNDETFCFKILFTLVKKVSFLMFSWSTNKFYHSSMQFKI